MTPEQFIDRWRGTTRSERSAAHEHFLDLCELLGVPKPQEVDRHGSEYTIEKATRKIGDSIGFADVWKRHCFAWEYKKSRRNLVEAYAQLKQYADALENPPLLIVSDMQEIRVHTNFTNAIAQQHVIPLAELRSVEARELLRNCFLHPERLLPTRTRESVTAEAAASLANIAVGLRRQYDERRVAHFINKLVFCLFAEDIELLPGRVFASILEAVKRPDDFEPMLRDLFRAMASRNGRFGATTIPWFNGGLFDDDDVLPLGIGAEPDLMAAARLDWRAIDPTIFGTLFESGLDDEKRAEMASLFDAPEPEDRGQARLFAATAADRGVGIHYTDEATIMKIIEPVVVAPLRREWEALKAEVRALDERRGRAKSPGEQTRLLAAARGLYGDFRARLGRYRVLDPACGSGNFLALALRALKDFDLAVLDDAAAMGLPRHDFCVGPEAVKGIEINGYAAELARLTVWITELQWQLQKGLEFNRRPILGRLDGIQRADALITPAGKEREWPEANVAVGNPPFLGGKWMLRTLGGDYVKLLRSAYVNRIPPTADLVAYWFEKARKLIVDGKLHAAGFVATNMIRGKSNRPIMQALGEDAVIFDAWSDEPWVVEGAAVRVSLICFSRKKPPLIRLDGHNVSKIFSDVSGGSVDITKAAGLLANTGKSVRGIERGGAFDISGAMARQWLKLPLNPNGRPNSDVLKPLMSGHDLAQRPSDKWIIDFGTRTEAEAALYEAVFTYTLETIKPQRSNNRELRTAERWWRHRRSGADLKAGIAPLKRFFATPLVSKHRFFFWLHPSVLPDTRLIIIVRDDEASFGILSSRFHERWTLRICQYHGVGNDPIYTPGSTFETFPFPEGLTPNVPAAEYENDPRAVAIAAAARRLDELREAWRNPPDLVRREPEVVAGYPDRILPVDQRAAAVLKKRTLTNLYNERPAWLDNAHRDLDAAVAAAYGWPADIAEEEALARLLALNLERAKPG